MKNSSLSFHFFFRVVICIGLLLIPTIPVQAASQPKPVRLGNERLVLAFYYTWFDENTWRSDRVPDFPLELYASRDRNVIAKHIEQAQATGIDAFVVSWYGPQVNNNQTETNLRLLLDEAASRNFRIAVDFETMGPFFRGAADVTGALQTLLSTHAKHPAYLRVDGRPVVFFWRQQRFNVSTWRSIRDQVDAAHSALWIAEGIDISFQEVFDGHHLYSVAWSSDPGVHLIKWGQRVRKASEKWGQKIWVATVMPGYNDTKTGRGDAFIRPRENGGYYEKTWNGALSSQPDWIVITSWNEWPEGSYIEPSQAYGNTYLDLTRNWVSKFKNGQASAQSLPIKPPVPTATPTPKPTPSSPQIVVKDAAVNVRAGPGVKYPILTRVFAGQEFSIVGKSQAPVWWQLCCFLSNNSGWVSADFVSAVGPLQNVKLVQPSFVFYFRPHRIPEN